MTNVLPLSPILESSKLTLKRTSVVDSGYYICDGTVNIDQPNLVRGFLQLTCKFYFTTCTSLIIIIANRQSARKFSRIVIEFIMI